MFIPLYVSCFICHMSHVICHVIRSKKALPFWEFHQTLPFRTPLSKGLDLSCHEIAIEYISPQMSLPHSMLTNYRMKSKCCMCLLQGAETLSGSRLVLIQHTLLHYTLTVHYGVIQWKQDRVFLLRLKQVSSYCHSFITIR